MSNLSQFFGGGSDKIEIELLVVAGGGGGNYALSQINSPSPTTRLIGTSLGSGGGGGGVYYGLIPVSPGSTCPIVIGGGGNGTSAFAPGDGTFGFNIATSGSPSIFNAPDVRYESFGGGFGGGINWPGPGFNLTFGAPGGSGGGATGQIQPGDVEIGYSLHSTGPLDNQSPTPFGGGAYYGNNGWPSSSPPTGGGYGGSSAFVTTISGIATQFGVGGNGTSGAPLSVSERRGYTSNQVPNTGHGGNALSPIGPGSPFPSAVARSGNPGVVIVRYPTALSPSFITPGGTDISPSTPGYRTYRFTSPGSITLP
jgi:hypothetical protein